MKTGATAKGGGRAYRMKARAEAAALTAERILDAARERFSTEAFEEVTLAAVAEDAGVTVQTVIRRFGGKDGLFAALAEREGPRIEADRTPERGDDATLREAIEALVDHYEADGPMVLNFLKQEPSSGPIAEVLAAGREAHEAWVARYCRPVLGRARGAARRRRLTAATAATDIYVWKLLRLDRGLSRAEAEKTMRMLLEGIGTARGER